MRQKIGILCGEHISKRRHGATHATRACVDQRGRQKNKPRLAPIEFERGSRARKPTGEPRKAQRTRVRPAVVEVMNTGVWLCGECNAHIPEHRNV